MADIPPTTDARLPAFALNLDVRGTATPGAYGWNASDLVVFHGLRLDYLAKLAVTQDPNTKTRAAVVARDISRRSLLAKARQLCKVAKANPAVSDTQRVELGLPPRDASPTPVPAPASRPQLGVDAYGNVRLVDEAVPTRRSKPAGTIGAIVLFRIAPAADATPITAANGHYAGLATRPKFAVTLPAGSTGQVLQVMALWVNPRGEHGPASDPASTTIAA